MLDIRPVRTKTRGLRINLYRKTEHIDPNTHKSKPSFRQIGSFSLAKSVPPDIWECLEPDETLQLRNWLNDAQFAAQYDHSEADDLVKLVVRVPKTFYQAIIEQQHQKGPDFIPNHIMLTALIEAMRDTSTADASQAIPAPPSPTPVIHTSTPSHKPKRSLYNEEADDACRVIFQRLLEISTPIGQVCTQLEDAALSIGKNKRISPKILRDWVTPAETARAGQRPKRWHFAIVIDVLNKNRCDPIQLIGPEHTATYYAIPRKSFLPKEVTKKKFLATFTLKPEQKTAALQAVDHIYQDTLTESQEPL